MTPSVVRALADGGLRPPVAETAPLPMHAGQRVPEKPRVGAFGSRTWPIRTCGLYDHTLSLRQGRCPARGGPKGNRQALEPHRGPAQTKARHGAGDPGPHRPDPKGLSTACHTQATSPAATQAARGPHRARRSPESQLHSPNGSSQFKIPQKPPVPVLLCSCPPFWARRKGPWLAAWPDHGRAAAPPNICGPPGSQAVLCQHHHPSHSAPSAGSGANFSEATETSLRAVSTQSYKRPSN